MTRAVPPKDETDQQRLMRVLEETGFSASPAEFAAVLARFKQDKDALSALRDGVTRRGRIEYRGDYAENGSEGYNDYYNKRKLMEEAEADNDRTFLAAFNVKASATPAAAGNDPLEKMQRQIDVLNARLRKLEEARFRLNPKS